MGGASEAPSLNEWMKALAVDKRKLWTGNKNPMKDFRACQGFWDMVLDGHVLASIAGRCGCSNVDEFASAIENSTTIDLNQVYSVPEG